MKGRGKLVQRCRGTQAGAPGIGCTAAAAADAGLPVSLTPDKPVCRVQCIMKRVSCVYQRCNVHYHTITRHLSRRQHTRALAVTLPVSRYIRVSLCV